MLGLSSRCGTRCKWVDDFIIKRLGKGMEADRGGYMDVDEDYYGLEQPCTASAGGCTLALLYAALHLTALSPGNLTSCLVLFSHLLRKYLLLLRFSAIRVSNRVICRISLSWDLG
jgi:hypothetical protein